MLKKFVAHLFQYALWFECFGQKSHHFPNSKKMFACSKTHVRTYVH